MINVPSHTPNSGVNNPLPLPQVDGGDTEYAGLLEWHFTVRHFSPEVRLNLFRQAVLSLKEPRAIQLLEGEIRMLSTTTDSGPLETGSNHLGVHAVAQGPQEPVYTGAPRSVLNPSDPTQLRPIGAVARLSESAAAVAILCAVAWGAYQFGSGVLGALKAAVQTLRTSSPTAFHEADVSVLGLSDRYSESALTYCSTHDIE